MKALRLLLLQEEIADRTLEMLAGAMDTLVVGDVVTVEPGLYRDGLGGVRIEDTLVVAQRPELLTRFPKELVILT